MPGSPDASTLWRERNVHYIDSNDLNTFATGYFGRPYNTGRGMDNPGQNTVAFVTITDEGWDSGDIDGPGPALAGWLATTGDTHAIETASPHPANILDQLFHDGVIPTGEYLVRLWW